MSRTAEELSTLSLLGNKHTDYTNNYDPTLLEAFPNKHPEADNLVTLDCPEFTSLCPKTGQPDFGRILIQYIPDETIVESKSLKLYLFSFREHGDFHEDCVCIIRDDLVRLLRPRYLEVVGLFNPRGGIAIRPFAQYADAAHQDLQRQRLVARMSAQ